MTMITQVKTRKEQRKEARKKRKRHVDKSQPEIQTLEQQTTNKTKKSKRDDDNENKNPKSSKKDHHQQQDGGKKKKKIKKNIIAAEEEQEEQEDPNLVDDAMHPDDIEIAELEKKLGITGTGKNKKKSKEKLNKEYAKLEGYGDNFGDFLDDLDDLVKRVNTTTTATASNQEEEYSSDEDSNFENSYTEEDSRDLEADTNISTKRRKKIVKERDTDMNTDNVVVRMKEEDDHDDDDDVVPSNNFDPVMSDAIRRDEEEIADLERKLGLGKRKEKQKLYKEYSKLEGYGDDFGEFLDGLDDMMVRVRQPNNTDYDQDDYVMNKNDLESEDDELVPMKDSILKEAEMLQNENDSDSDSDSVSETEDQTEEDQAESDSKETDNGTDDSDEDEDDEEEEEKREPDHDVADTYQPTKGEDIYGNTIDSNSSGDKKPSKYVPPHLRKKQSDGGDDEGEKEQRRAILRSLNNSLNRLSEDTLISISKQISQLYSSYPTPIVHELIWKNAKDVCIATPMLMVGLIPVYTACIAGVHILTGDTVQVGESILESVVADLWDRLGSYRKETSDDIDSSQKEIESKHICNLILFIGYLFNYNIIHCSFIYDIIRNLIENFSEVDIECLLILLSHCGRALRSDDPLALKEIVLLVQKKKMQNTKLSSSSRTDYMVSAIMDLKNNRRKREDTTLTETSAKFRKVLGRIKAAAAKSGISKSSSEASLRISLDDILNADTKGRWWKVGASWVGNQFRFSEDSQQEASGPDKGTALVPLNTEDAGDEKLLKLASKLRMNTDQKRAIFCIIMGGTDCEDTFEKLCRSSMLQNRSERDTVRVLMECCGNEKAYNKFYGHLAARICEYQPQTKFSLQLAYWDIFKQFDTTGARKGANLAKLLFHLVVTHQALRIFPVIKTIDLSDDEMDEATMIFLTILFSTILDHFDDPSGAKALFARHTRRSDERNSNDDGDEGIRAGLLVFFMETLKSSPKNTKGSRFRRNFKVIVKELDTDGFDDMF